MRVAFIGGNAFATASLNILVEDEDIDLCAVATTPSRPAGRGLKLRASAVANACIEQDVPFETPANDDDLVQFARKANADFLVVCDYGYKLSEPVRAAASNGCINVHASLLPRWRGAAPVERAIIAGDKATGVTIMQVAQKMDAGPILAQRAHPLGADATGGSVREQLAQMGAELLVETLRTYDAIEPMEQDSAQATHARKIRAEESLLDLTQPAFELERTIRAFSPRPSAHIMLNGKLLKILRAQLDERCGQPGEVLGASDQELIVAAGSASLRLLEVQHAGRKRMAIDSFMRGLHSKPVIELSKQQA